MTADQLLEQATERHRAGDLPEARRLYRDVLAGAPNHPLTSFRLGLLELQDGHPALALALAERAVHAAPEMTRFRFGLGQILATLGRWPEAVEAYQRVLAAEPESADAHFALGTALQSQGDPGGAIGAYQAAVRLQPDYPEASNNIGLCHQLAGDTAAAEAAYRRALALRPDDTNAMSNLGTLLQHRPDQLAEAVRLFRAAASSKPANAVYAVNLAAALCQQRQFSEAAAILDAVLAREPDHVAAAFNLGHALQSLGRTREAADMYRRVVSLQSNHADALNNLGNVLKELGELAPAERAYQAAIDAAPNAVVAMNNAGCLLLVLGRVDEAEAILRRGLELAPVHAALHANLGNVLKDAGRLDEAIDCFRKAVAIDPTDAASHSNLAYALSFQCHEFAPILTECRRWGEHFAAPLRGELRAHDGDRSPDRRLRIGYVSPDFREHCQSLFTIPVLSQHDHQAFEIFCYSSVARPDDYTRRIAGLADVWREVRPLDDQALAEVIRGDHIDVLVDLTMHMAHGRPLLFARKPAPVQIAWLAYPGTTGIAAMDYRLTDPRLDPPGFDAHYTERTIRLPDSFWCYDPLANQPDVNELPALARGHVTFGCLNNACKLTASTLRLWGGVLRAVPDGRLLLMAPPGRHREGLLDRLAGEGIARPRVSFVSYRPRADYLRSYHDIDVGLDTFPYNGHTTSLDSLWMGVPVVSRVGQTCVGRGGLSQLHNIGMTELAADTDEAFVNVALALARDLPRLARLRQTLRGRLEHSPLMTAATFTRNLEAVYRRTWRDHCLSSHSDRAA